MTQQEIRDFMIAVAEREADARPLFPGTKFATLNIDARGRRALAVVMVREFRGKGCALDGLDLGKTEKMATLGDMISEFVGHLSCT